jgi:hypothetical protein
MMPKEINEYLEEIKQNDPEHYQQILKEKELMMTKYKHGGARAGAGRKKAHEERVKASYTLDPDTKKMLKEASRATGKPQGEIVDLLIREGIGQKKLIQY